MLNSANYWEVCTCNVQDACEDLCRVPEKALEKVYLGGPGLLDIAADTIRPAHKFEIQALGSATLSITNATGSFKIEQRGSGINDTDTKLA